MGSPDGSVAPGDRLTLLEAVTGVPGPVCILSMADIDPWGTLAALLDVRSGEVCVIRLERLYRRGAGPGEKARAARRALGNCSSGEPGWWTPPEPVGV